MSNENNHLSVNFENLANEKNELHLRCNELE